MYRLGVYLGRTLRINRFYALPVGKVGKAAGYICGLISYDHIRIAGHVAVSLYGGDIAFKIPVGIFLIHDFHYAPDLNPVGVIVGYLINIGYADLGGELWFLQFI